MWAVERGYTYDRLLYILFIRNKIGLASALENIVLNGIVKYFTGTALVDAASSAARRCGGVLCAHSARCQVRYLHLDKINHDFTN